MTTATSFEFLAPNAYENHQLSAQNEPVAESSTTEDIPSREEITPQNICVQEENPDDKENIPPIEDKENIPPPPLHSMRPVDQPSVLKTPENTIDRRSESSILPNDLQKGVDLLNALIDSRAMSGEMKKKLIRKIVRHLLKSKDTKDITQMIMSFSDKSSTKMSGVCPLSDVERDDISANEKTAKDTISGVSTLSSSDSTSSRSVERNPSPVEFDRQVDNDSEGPKEIKQWLLPVTQSEIVKENARKSHLMQQEKTIPEEKPSDIVSNKLEFPKEEMKGDEKSSLKNNEILEFLENEKKTHFNWIDQEIEHLKNLKILFQSLNPNESDGSKGNVSDEKINSVYAKHHRDYLTIYENFRRNTNNISGNGSQADVSSVIGWSFFFYFQMKCLKFLKCNWFLCRFVKNK